MDCDLRQKLQQQLDKNDCHTKAKVKAKETHRSVQYERRKQKSLYNMCSI